MELKKSLLPLWILLGVFAAPPVASVVIHLTKKNSNLNTTQNGIFIKEAFCLDLKNSSKTTTKNWTVVLVTPEICQSDCLAKKQILNNLHKALGKDQKRVKILTVVNKDLIEQPDFLQEKSVMILNPNGLAIIHYAPSANPSGILKDLKKLLKNSHA